MLSKRFQSLPLLISTILLSSISSQLHAQTKAYVPFSQSANVAIIDTVSQSQVGTPVSVGGFIYGGALSPRGDTFFAADFMGARIVPIDTSTDTAGTPITVGRTPVTVTFSFDGSRAYVSNYGDNTISVVDVDSSAVVNTVPAGCAGPVGSVYTQAGLYLVCEPGEVRLLDVDALTTSQVVTGLPPKTYIIAVSETTQRAYVTSFEAQSVSAIDLSSNSVVANITTSGATPLGVAVTSDGAKAFVTDLRNSTKLDIIDTTTNTISSSVELSSPVAGLGLSSNSSVLYIVLSGVDAGILVFNVATETVATTITTSGTTPLAIWGDFLGNVAAQPPGVYNVGGTLSGLDAGKSVVLRNNGGDDLTLSINGSFNFITGLASDTSYDVTVLTQPDGQTCTVTNGQGTVASSEVTGISVTCGTAPTTVTIGGSVSGLASGRSVVLQNNGGDDKSLSANGAFTFDTEITSGGDYEVTILTEPAGQSCTVTDGDGTATADVTNVAVSCDIAISEDRSTVTASTSSVVAGSEATLTVTVRDTAGNPVPWTPGHTGR